MPSIRIAIAHHRRCVPYWFFCALALMRWNRKNQLCKKRSRNKIGPDQLLVDPGRLGCNVKTYFTTRLFLTPLTPSTLHVTSAALNETALELTKPLSCTMPL